MPRADDAWRSWVRAFRLASLCAELVPAMICAGLQAQAQGGDRNRAGVDAYFTVLRQRVPRQYVLETLAAPTPALRHEATISLTGWLTTKISARFPRIQKALGGRSPHQLDQALLEHLPAALTEALGDLAPDSDPFTIRTHAAEILAGGGERRRKRHPPSAVGRATRVVNGLVDIDPQQMLHEMWFTSPSIRPHLTELAQASQDLVSVPLGDLLRDAVAGKPTPVDLALRDFEMREEATSAAQVADDFALRESARALRDRYGLSEREAEVVALRAERWRHEHIGEHLGIAASTARVLFTRARRKIERAM
jgi:hypothetical protein